MKYLNTNLELLVGQTVKGVEFEKSPLDEHGYRYARIFLDNGMVLRLTPDDYVQPYDPFFVVDLCTRRDSP